MFSKKKLLKFKKQAVILNVNSLFSLAVFVGLVWNPTDPISCSPSPKIAEDFIAFHVYSFSSFLSYSLALSLLNKLLGSLKLRVTIMEIICRWRSFC
jgi:hypothetical protein